MNHFIPFRWKSFEVTKEKREWTPRRIACAKNSVRRQKEAIPLFPELATDQTVEGRMLRMDQRELKMTHHLRHFRAKAWLKARKLRRLLPTEDSILLMSQWQQSNMPAEPVAFLTFAKLRSQQGALSTEATAVLASIERESLLC